MSNDIFLHSKYTSDCYYEEMFRLVIYHPYVLLGNDELFVFSSYVL